MFFLKTVQEPDSVETVKKEEVKEDVPTLLLPDTTVEGFPTLELNQETENDPIYDVSDDDIFDAPETMKMLREEENTEDMFDIDEAFAEKVDTNATDFAVDDVNSNSDDIAIDKKRPKFSEIQHIKLWFEQ